MEWDSTRLDLSAEGDIVCGKEDETMWQMIVQWIRGAAIWRMKALFEVVRMSHTTHGNIPFWEKNSKTSFKQVHIVLLWTDNDKGAHMEIRDMPLMPYDILQEISYT